MSRKIDLRRWFSKAVHQRGRVSYEMGRVTIVDVGRDSIRALCRTHHVRSEFEVFLSWGEERGKVHGWCTCPDAWNHNPCEHLAAVLFYLVDDGVFPPGVAIEPNTLVVRGRDEEDNTRGRTPATTSTGPDNGASSVIDRFPPHRSATVRALRPAHAWLAVLGNESPVPIAGVAPANGTASDVQIPAGAICYVLNLEASEESDCPVVALYRSNSTGLGTRVAADPFAITIAELADVEDRREREILRVLVDNAISEESRSRRIGGRLIDIDFEQLPLAPDVWDELLPELCQSGRFFWSIGNNFDPWHLVRWDAGGVWVFSLAIEQIGAESCYRVRGFLRREAEQLPVSDAVYFFGTQYVMFDNTLAPFTCAASWRWLNPLVVAGLCDVPFADRESLQRLLWSQSGLDGADLPESLRLEHEIRSPVGRLRLLRPIDFRSSAALPGRVDFLYGDAAVAPNSTLSQIADVRRGMVIPRDLDREIELNREFFNVAKPIAVFPDDDLDVDDEHSKKPMMEFDARTIEQSIYPLMGMGWVVEAEGLKLRRPGEFALSVTSELDWFDVRADVMFDGVPVQMPELLAAIRQNTRFVRLADGSQGMMPQEWLDQYRAFVELGEAQGNSLRFRSSQIAVLDALLAVQNNPVQLDAQYRSTRDQLLAFNGIRSAEADQKFRGTLRDYQRDGLGWLEFLREYSFGGCLADDMGLGKTIQVLALLQRRAAQCYQSGQPRPASLAVVPKSVVYNWVEEAGRFTPNLRVLDYTGLDRHARIDQLNGYDLIVTTYGTLRRDILRLKDIKFDYAILDEAQAIKNAKSQAAKACRLLRANFRLAMTGTPVENRLEELWSLFEFLNPGMLGRSRAFQTLLSNLRRGENDHESPAIRLLAQAVRPFVLRRTKQEVIKELPSKTEHTLYCTLSGQQKRLYGELRDYYRQLLQTRIRQTGIKQSKIQVLEALLRLRQAACHPGLLDEHRRSQPSAKLELLEEQIQEVLSEGHKVLVFSQFTKLLGIIKQRFDTLGITYEYLDGRTRNRQEPIERFQNDVNVPVFLISLKAGGLGLNLTAADYVYILDPWWNPAVEAQAINRAHRIGQTRPVIANRIICRDTVEEKIVQLQASKRKLVDAIVSADSSLLESLTLDDLQLLLS